ncbi:hypothetical protein ACSFA3_00035 [Variovorax sp. RHLX14]|uniref:hypothetical protein n=1 Tax=Variovorax sp. RHLX14 TaxID=1259731 RepID=UPI003F47BA3C
MTALIQSKRSNTVAPESQASRLLGLVKEIENAAKEANVKVAEIESRGFLKNLVTSSRDDLVSTAKSQSRINDLLVRLNQEVVALNTLGYVYLASVFAEFERQINEGVRDSDGKIHVLSESGKRVASAAKEMFSAILDSSRSTQEKIDATAEVADALRADVDRLTQGALAHSELIDGLQVDCSALLERSERLGALAVQQHVSIEQLASRVEEDRLRASESDSRIAQTIRRLESEFERVAASAFAHSELIDGLQVDSSALLERTERLGALAVQQHLSIEQLASRVEEDRLRASERDSRIAQTIRRLESEFERVAASTVALRDQMHSLLEATSRAQATSEEHRALAAEHSAEIGRAAESVRKLIAVEGETTAQLELLVKSYRGFEHDVPTLAAQMAKMTASQTNEKSQLLRAIWALGANVAALIALSCVLALKTWQIF